MPGSLADLLALLPDIYAIRDVEARGEVQADAVARDFLGPLASLLDLMAQQGEHVERDVEALYDDWFIETCSAWLVPYIGDLLGVRRLRQQMPEDLGSVSSRAFVANTMRLRRGKGTARVLGELASDASGYPAFACEYFAQLATTQHVNHRRLDNVRTPDLRDADALELLQTPFSTAARTGEIRHVTSGRGRFNIPSIGLHVWTLQVFPFQQVRARPAREAGADPTTCFRINPLGVDAPLFNLSPPGVPAGSEASLPGALRRLPLCAELEALRAGGSRQGLVYFAPGQEPFQIAVQPAVGVPAVPVGPEQLAICNLEAWGHIPNGVIVAVDPVRGRARFAVAPAAAVFTNASFGFSAPIGGGPYDRTRSVFGTAGGQEGMLPDSTTFLRVVNSTPRPGGAGQPAQLGRQPDLDTAVQQWNATGGARDGVIVVENSDTYAEPPVINLAGGGHLLIVAGRWRSDATPPQTSTDALTEEIEANLIPDDVRPHVLGQVRVAGPPGGVGAAFGLSGLAIEGAITIAGNLAQARLADCTVVPPNALTVAAGGADALRFSAERCLLGPVVITGSPQEVLVRDAVVHGPVAGTDARIDLTRVTVQGTVEVGEAHASDSIFVETVTATRLQQGCVRFSFLPETSRVPRRYRCQPQLARESAPPGDAERSVRAVTPSFTSMTSGAPAYAQLATTVPQEITAGASTGGEMGAFASTGRTQRLDDLRAVLPEYLRAGLKAGVFITT